jgi:hypothetical protein
VTAEKFCTFTAFAEREEEFHAARNVTQKFSRNQKQA